MLPYIRLPNPEIKTERGQGQFGSSDLVAWVADLGKQRPFKKIRINGKLFNGLLDTGADKTCLAGKDWPQSWPVEQTSPSLQGLSAQQVEMIAVIMVFEEFNEPLIFI